jgi:GTP-binding protein HflX
LNKSVDRSVPVQRALVVHPVRPAQADPRDPKARLEEAVGLAMALDLVVAESAVIALRGRTPATLFG